MRVVGWTAAPLLALLPLPAFASGGGDGIFELLFGMIAGLGLGVLALVSLLVAAALLRPSGRLTIVALALGVVPVSFASAYLVAGGLSDGYGKFAAYSGSDGKLQLALAVLLPLAYVGYGLRRFWRARERRNGGVSAP